MRFLPQGVSSPCESTQKLGASSTCGPRMLFTVVLLHGSPPFFSAQLPSVSQHTKALIGIKPCMCVTDSLFA
jgi:hypothetical protein